MKCWCDGRAIIRTTSDPDDFTSDPDDATPVDIYAPDYYEQEDYYDPHFDYCPSSDCDPYAIAVLLPSLIPSDDGAPCPLGVMTDSPTTLAEVDLWFEPFIATLDEALASFHSEPQDGTTPFGHNQPAEHQGGGDHNWVEPAPILMLDPLSCPVLGSNLLSLCWIPYLSVVGHEPVCLTPTSTVVDSDYSSSHCCCGSTSVRPRTCIPCRCYSPPF